VSRYHRAAVLFLLEAADQAAGGAQMVTSTDGSSHDDLCRAGLAAQTLTQTAESLTRYLAGRLTDYDATRILHDDNPAMDPTDRLANAAHALDLAADRLTEALAAIRYATGALAHIDVDIDLATPS
jgi:hypothetical protein